VDLQLPPKLLTGCLPLRSSSSSARLLSSAAAALSSAWVTVGGGEGWSCPSLASVPRGVAGLRRKERVTPGLSGGTGIAGDEVGGLLHVVGCRLSPSYGSSHLAIRWSSSSSERVRPASTSSRPWSIF
jgi:hypothetical protein